jgi:zinc transporter 7
MARAATTSSLVERLFAILFPGGPAVNALLATLYISGPPNFLLALCPPNIDPSSLSTMVAFAVGGLMGDTLFHLLPEIFLGEDRPERARFVLVEPNRNLLLGVAILVGFMTFVAVDKGLRIATGGAGHDHAHGHANGQLSPGSGAASTAVEASAARAVKNRKKDGKKAAAGKTADEHIHGQQVNPSVKLGGYLNLMWAVFRACPRRLVSYFSLFFPLFGGGVCFC